MDIFKLIISHSENRVSITTSEPMTFVNISSPRDLRRRLANVIANISQRHKANWVCVVKYVILFKTCFTWCVSELQPLVIYLRKFKSLSMYDLGTSIMRLELGNLSLNIERRVNWIKGAWPHWTGLFKTRTPLYATYQDMIIGVISQVDRYKWRIHNIFHRGPPYQQFTVRCVKLGSPFT